MSDCKGLVFTNKNCVGCNKCINVCSSNGACIPKESDIPGKFYVEVNSEKCIACGACFDACEHGAREYCDDTERFFEDLARGEKISLLLAPSFAANYPDEYKEILGGLRNLGARRIINVGFGADIAAWGYVKCIKDGFMGGISQPCPAVVSYIEKYEPELLPKLFPIQSPLICAATYARKQLGITDKFAFISPCIAKKIEIDDPNTHGLVSYNVTFYHLMNYIKKHNIKGDPCTDEIEFGLGGIWPMPGGLKENMMWLLGEDVFIRQIEGEKRLYGYLRKNAGNIVSNESGFMMLDVLNCESGCLCGTAIDKTRPTGDDAFSFILRAKNYIKANAVSDAWKHDMMPSERCDALMKQFADLDINDYKREYTDRSANTRLKMPTDDELELVFLDMRKDTEEKRTINCMACGNESCKEMAIAIYNGFNSKRNCVHMMKDLITEEQEQLRYLAEYDQALGIYNRRTVERYMLENYGLGSRYAVIVADLNGFKGINLTYGTEAGDILLKKVAGSLKELAAEKGWMLGRYGGDEFIVVVPGVNLMEESEEIGLLKKVVACPIMIGSEKITLSAGIGISNSDGETESTEHILNAENAMFVSKANGKSKAVVFSKEQRDKMLEENEIGEMIVDAIENDGFYMLYQPQVDTKTKQVTGYEALVRMKRGGVYPGQFIPIAEKNGWIWKIGRITTELVVRQLAEWRDCGHELCPVSVNFSSNQLRDEGYIDFLDELLKKYDIPTRYFKIEITESVFMGDSNQSRNLFERFKEMGIKLLMDDFGTGYSSLGYLTYVPVDVIKLDKSFVDNFLVEGKDSFIKNIIQLVHDLGKGMIIEGVEEKDQYERLREFGADTIQGYYFSKPIPQEEAISFVPKS
ncbi:MAG: EAL domain-containing protein [Lachnospiraceae bacterium]|nr:EAL domain-containing protein [Lachnospiraceae bacterium]